MMPRLTVDLTGPKHPRVCQACSGEDDGYNMHRWQEHDENDKPENRYLVLCDPCAKKIIEPHPRLYRELPRSMPQPGSMTLCADCIHRIELRCLHPLLKANGGPGLPMMVYGTKGFIDGRDYRGIYIFYGQDPQCEGREEAFSL